MDSSRNFQTRFLVYKEECDLQGIKAEFETEGSSYRDLVRLRRITGKLNIPLYLKIGGVEALRDIKDSLEIGVDGLIALMVDSRFGLKKFIDPCSITYKGGELYRAINIETSGSFGNLDEILGLAKGQIYNVTLGRTDLSNSFFNKIVTPDSDKNFKILEEVANKVRIAGMPFTLGGSLRKEKVFGLI